MHEQSPKMGRHIVANKEEEMTDIVPNGMDAGWYPNAGKGRQASEVAVEEPWSPRFLCIGSVFAAVV